MPRIELQYLLKPTTTPEQEILLNSFYSRFDAQAVGNNRHIANVEPLFYNGFIAGTEFLVYAATKMYICYKGSFSAPSYPSTNSVEFYDETNTAVYYINKLFPYWDATAAAAKYVPQYDTINNIIFSRIVTGFACIVFNGYRITLN